MIPLPPDPYKILGVAPESELSDIRAAHRKLVKLCHPDKISTEASDDERVEKEEQFKKVQKAYEILSDENERRKYDEQVKLHKRYQSLRTAQMTAAAAAAFSTPRRADTWGPESPTSAPHHPGVNIRTAEPRPGTFSSRSPPKTTQEVPRYEQPRPNIKVSRTTTEPQRTPRRTSSYESRSSPTEDAEQREKAKEDLEKEVKRLQKELEREQRKSGRAEKSSSKSSKKEEKPSSRKSTKEAYVEEPNANSKSKTKKSSHKHRSSKDRSRSRSNNRQERTVREKPSRDYTQFLRPEVEEAEDSETNQSEGGDGLARTMNSAQEYIQKTKLHNHPVSAAAARGAMPVAPTPPPPSGGHSPPPHPPQAQPRVVEVGPDTHPHLRRSTTAPAPTSGYRSVPEPQYPYQDPSRNRGRARSGLAAQVSFDEDDYAEDSRGGVPLRTRRGSSNAYAQSYPAHPFAEGSPPSYYTEHPSYYSSGTSPKFPTSHQHISMRHVQGVPGGPAPSFQRVRTSPVYTSDSISYGQIPHEQQHFQTSQYA